MPFPKLDVSLIQQAVPEASDIQFIAQGGQKVVYSCRIEGESYALKILQPRLHTFTVHRSRCCGCQRSSNDVR